MEQGRAEGIDVAPCIGLLFAILLWRGVASRAHGDRIFSLFPLMRTGYPEIDQLEETIGGEHHIGGFEVAVDNGWVLGVQVVEHTAELDTITDRVRLE